ncbi:MAG: HAMP domain-containing sensor histidine kinase [Bacteroidota bacterium]|jgi:signal transduction histidine kinase|nr:HAMP domain-containing histidine kinase [Prolixibacteraceae bacterium]MDI9564124.1 HAMP domain-containing sensor histidine kinase [Bacteroidota bacterium]NLS99121.1 HAMP domain-containing histidine kinase [Bacteroidales bacterium]OQB79606.1 MAG: Histidine protein kinase DivJ [Bacteroidetes bacterium ADurb.Bin123]HNZ69278.1 HAMP domain-containing sensor histidine kinase [Prolixibacteraceae bacterium]
MKITTDKIISIIAHDLKDPLSAIAGISDILIHNWVDFSDDEKMDILNEIRDTSDATYKMLNDLLDWNKKLNAYSAPERKVFNAGEGIRRLVKTKAMNLKRKSIRLENRIPVELMVKGDLNMFEAIFRNLLGNAIKSCNEGGSVNITADRSDSFYRFCIADDGIGMTHRQIDILFSRAGNTSRKSLPSSYGNGFGLILCKDFIEMQGGQLWAESEEGKGTRVYFTFPASDL